MGHVVNADREYRLLQQRLDRNVTGAPDSPVLMKILRLLFSEREAELASRMPMKPARVEALSARLGVPADELAGKLDDMARRGLVIDFEMGGRRYYMLAPVVIGFFEFTFMRKGDDLPMAELAKLFDEYMRQDDRFARTVFAGQTQIGRALVHEEALPEGDHTEILDWERASKVVGNASAAAVGLCACRHKAQHLGKACDRPLETCMVLNAAAPTMVRNGLARSISTEEALRIIEDSKRLGMVQTGDNVQREISYICNCCKCCCGMIEAIRELGMPHAIVTSNWVMAVEAECCTGCGRCTKACPVDAIALEPVEEGGKKQRAAVDAELCLGCGVCYAACKSGAIRMQSRPQRVYTPETVFDRVVAMAIERGKLAELIFDSPERLTYRVLGRVLGAIEKSPPFRALMAIAPLRSAFLDAMVRGPKQGA